MTAGFCGRVGMPLLGSAGAIGGSGFASGAAVVEESGDCGSGIVGSPTGGAGGGSGIAGPATSLMSPPPEVEPTGAMTRTFSPVEVSTSIAGRGAPGCATIGGSAGNLEVAPALAGGDPTSTGTLPDFGSLKLVDGAGGCVVRPPVRSGPGDPEEETRKMLPPPAPVAESIDLPLGYPSLDPPAPTLKAPLLPGPAPADESRGSGVEVIVVAGTLAPPLPPAKEPPAVPL